jgi:hypothetical protein
VNRLKAIAARAKAATRLRLATAQVGYGVFERSGYRFVLRKRVKTTI